jgi:probable phosphoglycerate mutase
MDIYLVRHGESTGNKQNRFMGWSDHPLSVVGQQQADAAANRFAALGPMPVVCSDLLRARQTAGAIAANWETDIITDSRWREVNFGDFDDKPWVDFSNDAELSAMMGRDPINTVWPQGESSAMMADRVVSAFLELCRGTDEKICVVSHGGPIHAVVAHCLRIPPERYWVLTFNHTGITHIKVSESWTTVITVNDTGHL